MGSETAPRQPISENDGKQPTNGNKMYRKEVIHFRTENDDGSINPRGGVTVCYLPNENGTGASFGVAMCCPDDNYIKRRGATMAEGRAIQNMKKENGSFLVPTLHRLEMFEKAKGLAEYEWSRLERRHNRFCDPLITSFEHATEQSERTEKNERIREAVKKVSEERNS